MLLLGAALWNSSQGALLISAGCSSLPDMEPELQVEAVSWGCVCRGKESSHSQQAVTEAAFFDWRKGLICSGFIHYLAARETVSLKKRTRNFPQRYTKTKRIVLKGKESSVLESRQSCLCCSSIQSKALHPKKLQRRNLRKKSSSAAY